MIAIRLFNLLKLVCLSLLAGMALMMGADQSSDRSEWETIRGEYEARRQEQTEALKRLQLARLRALETSLAEAAKYEEARRCRDERQNLKETMDFEGPLEIVLWANEAIVAGDLLLDRGLGEGIRGWGGDPTISKASWALPDLPLGGYQVWVEHEPLKDPIKVRLSEPYFYVEGLLSEGQAVVRKGVARSSLGYLKVTNSVGPISLTTSDERASNESLCVRSLVFVAQAPSW